MMQFLGEDNLNTSFEKARVVILPVPVEFSTSYGKGTARGPEAIIAASGYVELYDEELNLEIWKKGIHTLPALPTEGQPAKIMEAITARVAGILGQNKFPVILGGEHSISSAVHRAFREKFPDLSVLQLDAHSDLREEYEGSPWSHASVMRRIWEHNKKIVQVGIRAQCIEEREFIVQNKIFIRYAHQLKQHGFTDALIRKLDNHVFITFDVDFFDPSIMPSTGTPEPGGFLWYETLDFLRRVFRQRTVVGFDVVELSPIPELKHPDFLTARLVSKLIGFHFMEKRVR